MDVSSRNATTLAVLAAVGVTLTAVALHSRRSEASEAGLNVVLITLDTTRADALGCYGAAEDATPFMDTIASAGVVFERCSTSSAITPVAHASILTGLEPYEHGLRVFTGRSGYRLPESIPTLATILGDRGYTTVAVHGAFPVSSAFGFENGFDIFESFDDYEAGFVQEMESETASERSFKLQRYQRRCDATIGLVLRKLDEVTGPVFLWVHLFDPHDAKLRPPKDFLSPEASEPIEDPERYREALYAEEIRFLDSQLGRLLHGLQDRGRSRDTILAVVADHGEGLAGGLERHGWYRHAILYEDQLRVPLLLAGPGLPSGQRVSAQVRTIDLMPTLLELSGVPVPEKLSGKSLLPLLRSDGPNRLAYAEQLNGYELLPPSVLKDRPHDDFVYSISDGEWKLLYRPAHPQRSELFNLASDPGEVHDLSSSQPRELERLLRELAARKAWLYRQAERQEEDPNVQFTDALLALGYTAVNVERSEVPTWEWSCISCGALNSIPGICLPCAAPRVLIASGESPLVVPGEQNERR